MNNLEEEVKKIRETQVKVFCQVIKYGSPIEEIYLKGTNIVNGFVVKGRIFCAYCGKEYRTERWFGKHFLSKHLQDQLKLITWEKRQGRLKEKNLPENYEAVVRYLIVNSNKR